MGRRRNSKLQLHAASPALVRVGKRSRKRIPTYLSVSAIVALGYYGSLLPRIFSTAGGRYVWAAAREWSVNPVVAVLIMWRESRGRDPGTVGAAGEIGIMQVTPIAMQDTGWYINTGSSLEEQAVAGVAYMAWLKDNYPDKSVFWRIRAYNAGAGGANRGVGQNYLYKVLSGL